MKEKFIITFISQLITYVIHLLASLLLFLNLEVIILGKWAFINSIVNIGFLFINIGFETIHLQYSGKDTHSEYFGTFFLINIILILINLSISLTLLTFLQLWNSTYIYLILILIFSKITSQLANIFFIELKCKIKIFKAEIPFFFTKLGKSISIFFLFFYLEVFGDPLFLISISYLIFDLLFLLLLLIFAKRDVKFNRPKKKYFYHYIKDVKPILLFSVISVIAINLGELIIRYSVGLESLGYYSLINSYIITPLLMISGIFIQLSIVLYSVYFRNENLLKIKQTSYILEKYFSIIFLTFIIIVFLNGELIFTTFFPNYINSVQILYILIFIPYFIGITRPYSIPLVAGKKMRIKYNLSTFTYILIMVLMIFFIPEHFLTFPALGLGIIGSALGNAIPWSIWMILNKYYSYKFFDLKPQKGPFLHALFAVISLFVSTIIRNWFLDIIIKEKIILLILSTLFLLCIFYSLLFVSKQLKRNDIKFFFKLFDFKSYIVSLKDEFSSK